jgi:hypothetical protein
MRKLLLLLSLCWASAAAAQSYYGGPGNPFPAATDDSVPVGNGSAWVAKVIPICNATDHKILQYDTASNAFSCVTLNAPTYYQSSGATNSTTSPASSGIIFSVFQNSTFSFVCNLIVQGTATGGPRLNMDGSQSVSQINYTVANDANPITGTPRPETFQALSGSSQTAACTTSCTTTPMGWQIIGTVTQGAVTGTISVRLSSSTAGQSVSVLNGSYCAVF